MSPALDMKKSSKIVLAIGLLIFVSGIILEIIIRTMSGSIIELRNLEPTLASIGLTTSGIIIMAIMMVYNQFNQRKAV